MSLCSVVKTKPSQCFLFKWWHREPGFDTQTRSPEEIQTDKIVRKFSDSSSLHWLCVLHKLRSACHEFSICARALTHSTPLHSPSPLPDTLLGRREAAQVPQLPHVADDKYYTVGKIKNFGACLQSFWEICFLGYLTRPAVRVRPAGNLTPSITPRQTPVIRSHQVDECSFFRFMPQQFDPHVFPQNYSRQILHLLESSAINVDETKGHRQSCVT